MVSIWLQTPGLNLISPFWALSFQTINSVHSVLYFTLFPFKIFYTLLGKNYFLFCCNIFYLKQFSWTRFFQWLPKRKFRNNNRHKAHLSHVFTFSLSSSPEYVPLPFSFLEGELMLYTDGLLDKQMVPTSLTACSRGKHVCELPAQNGTALKTTTKSWWKGCFLTIQSSAQLLSFEFLEIWETHICCE